MLRIFQADDLVRHEIKYFAIKYSLFVHYFTKRFEEYNAVMY